MAITKEFIEIKPDKKAVAWQRKNEWFGKDEHKTTHALIMHSMLMKMKVDARSKKYYDLIDLYMNFLNFHRLDKGIKNGRQKRKTNHS